ncbi:MAG: hypothetical protein IJH75_00220 [Mogibacterium sp.]|nr:hypothetical protein [Mogibacterium sp.]
MKRIATLVLVLLLAASVMAGCGGAVEPEPGMANDLAGTTWSPSDGSYLIFGEPGAENGFLWYLDREVTDDNFYGGSYQLYRGEAAVTYVTEDLADYGVTKEELDRLFANGESSAEDFVAMTVSYATFVRNGEEQIGPDEDRQISYYGFLSEEELAIVNMNTGGLYQFSPVE